MNPPTTKVLVSGLNKAEASATEAVATKADAAPAEKLSAEQLIRAFEQAQQKSDLPDIYVGDTVRVGVRISEGNKERVQPYEGVVISKRHGGLNETITVRRIFQGIGLSECSCSTALRLLPSRWSGAVKCVGRSLFAERVGKATRVKQRFDR